MVLFDAGILIKLLDPRTPEAERDKLDYLVTTLQKDKTKILIPTPALSEFYVKADPEVMDAFKNKSAFLIVPFDERAALECAVNVADVKRTGNKKGTQKEATWAKVKFDHQIVAIAKIHGAEKIYSEDHGLRLFAAALNIKALSVADLPENPASAQKNLDLQVPDQTISSVPPSASGVKLAVGTSDKA